MRTVSRLWLPALVAVTSLAFPEYARAWKPVTHMLLAKKAAAWRASAAEPGSAPLDDPGLSALLRPKDGVVEDHLTRAQDGKVYYVAKLKHFALPGFTKRYLAELEDRGMLIRPVGSSPHVLPQVVIGYNLFVWQEASLDPYSFRYRVGEERRYERPGEPALTSLPHPVSVVLDRLTVRLPGDFASPWKTQVVVLDHSAELPFPLPLPKGAMAWGATDFKGKVWRDGVLRETDRPVQTIIEFQSRAPQEEIREFYRRALAEYGRLLRDDSGGRTSWALDHLPPWAPPFAHIIMFDPQNALVGASDGGKGVFDCGAADAFQKKTLPHLPCDVHAYWINIGYEDESGK